MAHPEVESVPWLFLRVDAVGFGSADCPDVGLVALFEVYELKESKHVVIIICKTLICLIRVTFCTSSPICGTKGERRGIVSIIHVGGSHSSASSPAKEDVGF